MENIQLANMIDEVQEIQNAVTDASVRCADTNGFFSKLESIGIQTGYVQRDFISLSLHLSGVLDTMRQTLKLWQEVKNIADQR